MKKCFKCNSEKPIDEFYKHSAMADGHLGKCIDCAKKDVAERVSFLRLDPEWIAKERARCRAKQARARAVGKATKPKLEHRKLWCKRNKHKKYAHSAVAHAVLSGKLIKPSVCSECGLPGIIQGHHDDYSKPLQIRWLCTKCHGKAHWKK